MFVLGKIKIQTKRSILMVDIHQCGGVANDPVYPGRHLPPKDPPKFQNLSVRKRDENLSYCHACKCLKFFSKKIKNKKKFLWYCWRSGRDKTLFLRHKPCRPWRVLKKASMAKENLRPPCPSLKTVFIFLHTQPHEHASPCCLQKGWMLWGQAFPPLWDEALNVQDEEAVRAIPRMIVNDTLRGKLVISTKNIWRPQYTFCIIPQS
jgi:hypothetical protein